MEEYNGWLYLGTSDWRFWPTYLSPGGGRRTDLSTAQFEYLRYRTRQYNGGFSFWRSQDGITWVPITTDGFNDNPFTYGIRELTASPYGLFVATTSTRGSRRGGGLEVWLGSADETRGNNME